MHGCALDWLTDLLSDWLTDWLEVDQSPCIPPCRCVALIYTPRGSQSSPRGALAPPPKLGPLTIYSVDLEVWSKLAKRARIKHIASKFAHDFECDLQRVNAFSHCILWHLFYFRKWSLAQLQKCWFLLLWNVSVQMWYYVGPIELIFLLWILQGHVVSLHVALDQFP